MKFNVIDFPSEMFTPVDDVIVAEVSDMESRHLQPLPNGKRGFNVKSNRTGAVITYVMVGTLKDPQGELVGWEYRPSWESIRKYPECAETRAVVIND